MISVLVLTRNEELDLPGCLSSVSWSDDIHVFDSGSSDGTLNIARSMGATVTVRTYPTAVAFGGDEASHRNWALDNIPFRHEWVFCIDADERVTEGLRSSMQDAVLHPGGAVAFRIQRRDFFMGTWLRYVQTSPYYLRLFKRGNLRYKRLVNPVAEPTGGSVRPINGFLDHFPFSKGLGHWIDRHNNYSALEARQIVENRASRAKFSLSKALAAKDFHERRFHQKELFYRVPMRPFAKFLILYLGKRGFLDGVAGFTYATLQAIYEYFIVLKVRELEASRPTP